MVFAVHINSQDHFVWISINHITKISHPSTGFLFRFYFVRCSECQSSKLLTLLSLPFSYFYSIFAFSLLLFSFFLCHILLIHPLSSTIQLPLSVHLIWKTKARSLAGSKLLFFIGAHQKPSTKHKKNPFFMEFSIFLSRILGIFFWSFLFAYLDAFHWRTRKNKRKNSWNHTDWHAIDRCLNRWTIFISSPHCCFNLSAIYFDNIVFMLLSCQFCWVSLFLSTSEYKSLKYADFMAFEQKHCAFQIIARTV